MPINVICPGCLKRFQVSIRFSGMQGPCPNCATIIAIPKESLKILGDLDDAESEKEKKRNAPHHPIPRSNQDFDPVQARYYALGVLGVLLLTFVLGSIPMPLLLRSLSATVVLCFVAFPLTLFGYHVLRDREQIIDFTGSDLYCRSGIVAAGYVILWFVFECFLTATRADVFVSWFYFAACVLFATLLVHPILEMKTRDACLHFCTFAFPVIVLRFFIGFGWFWQSNEWIRYSTAPPPPLLPGM